MKFYSKKYGNIYIEVTKKFPYFKGYISPWDEDFATKMLGFPDDMKEKARARFKKLGHNYPVYVKVERDGVSRLLYGEDLKLKYDIPADVKQPTPLLRKTNGVYRLVENSERYIYASDEMIRLAMEWEDLNSILEDTSLPIRHVLAERLGENEPLVQTYLVAQAKRRMAEIQDALFDLQIESNRVE